jgi:hypothetical protein
MTAFASCSDSSAKSTPIVGCDTRMMTKAKKPTSAKVTTPIAAIRAGPSRVRKSTAPFTLRGTCSRRDLAGARRAASLGKNFPVQG